MWSAPGRQSAASRTGVQVHMSKPVAPRRRFASLRARHQTATRPRAIEAADGLRLGFLGWSARFRLTVALLLGSAIGFERQWHQKMAGLRTNALVALGACGFVVFSGLVGQGDPTRVAAQVVSGIGFLGAGIILRDGVNVHGLNTAATLWCSAMVGTISGAGYVAQGLLAAGFVIGTNLVLRPLVRRVNRLSREAPDAETHYTVEIVTRAVEEAHVRSLLLRELSQAGLGLRRLDSEDIEDSARVRVTAQAMVAKRNDTALEQIVGRLSLEPQRLRARPGRSTAPSPRREHPYQSSFLPDLAHYTRLRAPQAPSCSLGAPSVALFVDHTDERHGWRAPT